MMFSDELLTKLGEELINSPFLSVMVVNRSYEVVWHNRRFAKEFNSGMPIEGKLCFEAAGSDGVHTNCPLQKSIESGKCSKGFLDFGDRNFLFLTIPLDGEHAAKVHIFLPKEADNSIEDNGS